MAAPDNGASVPQRVVPHPLFVDPLELEDDAHDDAEARDLERVRWPACELWEAWARTP